jgi:transposase
MKAQTGAALKHIRDKRNREGFPFASNSDSPVRQEDLSMAVSYSLDFRRAVAAHVGKGVSCSGAAVVFGTSRSFVINLMRRYRETGDLGPCPRGGARHSKLVDHRDEIIGWIEAQPSITLQQMAERLAEEHGMTASTSGLSDMLRKAGFTYKKIHAGKRSRARPTSAKAA